MNPKTTVSSVKCDNYIDAEKAVNRAIELLGGIDKFVRPGQKVLLKPNLLFGLSPERCVTTHPAVLKAVAQIVLDAGCKVIMGDSPVAGTGTFHNKKAGFRGICEELDIKWVDFENSAVEIEGNQFFKKLTVAKPVMEADAIINLPKLKTHAQTYLTICVKNMFGIIPGVRKTRWHMHAGKDVLHFSKMLVETCYLKKPVLNIVDGVLAMDGNGPRGGDPYPLGYILAGEEPTAVDRVAIEMLKVSPDKVPTISAAEALEIGITNLEEIAIKGDDPYNADVKNFRFCGQHLPIDMGMPGRVISLFDDALKARPVIDHKICTRCGQCVDHCPADAMDLNGEEGDMSAKVSIDLDACIRCYCCSEICPEGSVSVKQGWLWNLLPGFMR